MKSKTLVICLVTIAISTLIAGIAVSVGMDAEQSKAGRFMVTAETQSGIYGVTVTSVTPSSDDLLGKYEKNDKRLMKYDFEDVIVYFHQRMIDAAIVEGDYIIYQFDRNTKELIQKRTHWRSGLPDHVTPVITKEQAESMVRGEVQFTKLYIISSDSVVFPLKPTPDNPCWIVRSVDSDSTIVTIIDAMEGKMLGYGIPPPTGFSFSFSGPCDTCNCTGVWTTWYRNAALWFSTMGYPTEAMTYPDEAKVKSHIQSNETVMFYELAHGGSWSFANNCSDCTDAGEIHDWIKSYAKMPFTFIGSCGGMCDLTPNHLSYVFRKSSMINTTTVGYCGMGTEDCGQAWSNSVNWQDAMFDYMNQGDTVKEAFDNAMADYPMCVGCMRFAGDENFAVVPVVERGTLTDVYEPDDNYNQANWISTDGTKQYHDFYVSGDQDWLLFNATANMPYKIETSYIGDESDTYIYLYDKDGITEITHDDDGGEGLASKIIWSCVTSGTYYIMVRHYSSSSSGSDTYYHISVSQCPPPTFNDVFADYGEDTDGDGLYNHLTIDIGVNVAIAGHYKVEGCLYDDLDNYIEKKSNYTYLNTGNQIVQLDFDGFKIRKNGANGTFDLKHLYLSNTTDGTQLDYIYNAYTTAYYNYTEFPIPPAEFNDVYVDYGEDTDGDGLYDYLVVDVGVNVTEAGDYEVSGYLYENGTYDSVDYDSNTTYLNEGNRTIQLRFEGIKIRNNEYNGTYDLKYLFLDDEAYPQLDYRYYAYTTSYYNYTDFQIPPAKFNDVYVDYGEDTDGDGLYDYLVADIGVNVTEVGEYRVSGYLYECGTYDSVDYDSNTTYLNEGSQTVQLRFEGIKIRQTEYNGTYDLKFLYLYNYSSPVPPPPVPTPTPPPISVPVSQHESKSTETEVISVGYGEQLDYRYYAYTTSYYNYTDFKIPPAEFNDAYVEYGEDTDGDGLYDYLVVDVGVNVREAGRYGLDGSLYENGTYNSIDYAYNTTDLNEGDQTIQLRFEGIKISNSGYNGTYDLKHLELYNATYPGPVPTPTPPPASPRESKSTATESSSVGYGEQLDYRYCAYTTSYYNYTEFEESIPDAYEPDDKPLLANYISVAGTKQTHNFHIPGDHDWRKFNATNSESYTIETSELGDESDTYLYLYDTNGITEIDNDDDSGIGLASKIVWNCSISGTYYVMVRHFSSSAFGPETRYNFSVIVKEAIFDTGSPANPYPSIMGNHTGTISPNHTVIATKLYTYPCVGTGGHTKYAKIGNATWNATATWKGYVGDWRNITFDKTVVLLANEEYNYTIRTGSYPQIIHNQTHTTLDGSFIKCTSFVDANGKKYNDWIPAIRLFLQ